MGLQVESTSNDIDEEVVTVEGEEIKLLAYEDNSLCKDRPKFPTKTINLPTKYYERWHKIINLNKGNEWY